jgi:tetratricopeptide (TPR) repeat protein
MRKYFILSLLFVLALGLSVSPAFAQTTGTVSGVCTDTEGKPIVGAEVEYVSTETGRKYPLKTNNKGEYFSLGVAPGTYNIKLSKDGKELFHWGGVSVDLGDNPPRELNLKKELANQAQGQGMTAEQLKAKQDAASKAENEKKTVGTLNDKLAAARTAMGAKDYETAITTLNEANQIDANRDTIWFELGNAYLGSAPTQTDPDEKKKRFETSATDYQKAIDLRTASDTAQKDPKNPGIMAAYYNNLAQAYSKSNKVDDAVTNYNKAAQLDPTHAGGYLFNIGAVYTNAGRVDDAIAAFDKVIAADPTKAAAYYWKGVNLIGKETIGKDGKAVAPEGTAEAFQKYLELEPTGTFAQPAKDMLTSIGAKVETGFGTKKKKQ